MRYSNDDLDIMRHAIAVLHVSKEDARNPERRKEIIEEKLLFYISRGDEPASLHEASQTFLKFALAEDILRFSNDPNEN